VLCDLQWQISGRPGGLPRKITENTKRDRKNDRQCEAAVPFPFFVIFVIFRGNFPADPEDFHERSQRTHRETGKRFARVRPAFPSPSLWQISGFPSWRRCCCLVPEFLCKPSINYLILSAKPHTPSTFIMVTGTSRKFMKMPWFIGCASSAWMSSSKT